MTGIGSREAAGSCPGYVADHVIPLRRGGADSVAGEGRGAGERQD
jgi:hypothetical protein